MDRIGTEMAFKEAFRDKLRAADPEETVGSIIEQTLTDWKAWFLQKERYLC